MKLIKKGILSVIIVMMSLISIVYMAFGGMLLDILLSFHSADLHFLENVELSEIHADADAAYYLSEDGTLYCSGANSDAGAYVVYQDKKQGIVAENVVSFGEMSNGGYYIDRNNNLYIYNFICRTIFIIIKIRH